MKKHSIDQRHFRKSRWKSLVRMLSCIVVFCTVYALILPAVTLEARSFCGSEEHRHSKECYTEEFSCSLQQHLHEDACYDEEGNLLCTEQEHEHSNDCFIRHRNCSLEEHEHTLKCYSDPQADIESVSEWSRSLPEMHADTSPRNRIIQTAESQTGQKESSRNYLVINETETKGISRYGQWDGEPYEDWSGAFVRFVLVHAQIPDDSLHIVSAVYEAPKKLYDWAEDLYRSGALHKAEEGQPGDVLFLYDQENCLKAGILVRKDEETITAVIGDWNDEVRRETFSIHEDRLYAVLKTVEDKEEDLSSTSESTQSSIPEHETAQNQQLDLSEENTESKEEEETPARQSSQSSSDPDKETQSDNQSAVSSSTSKKEGTEDPDSEKTAVSIKPEEKEKQEDPDQAVHIQETEGSRTPQTGDVQNRDESDSEKEDSIDEEANAEKKDELEPPQEQLQDHEISEEDSKENSASADYTYFKEAQAEDGTLISASWKEGTFENDEEVIFQVRKAQLSEQQSEQLESHLDKEKNYILKSYDIGFYTAGEFLENESIEPALPVRITVRFTKTEAQEDTGLAAGIFHFSDSGEIEELRKASAQEDAVSLPELEKTSAILLQDSDQAQFIHDDFSLYTIAYRTISDWKRCTQLSDIQTALNEGQRHIQLDNDLYDLRATINITSSNSSKDNPVVIDLNGHAMMRQGTNNHGSMINIFDGGYALICNQCDTVESPGNAAIRWTSHNGEKPHSIGYMNEDGKYIQKTNVGVIAAGNTGDAVISMYKNAGGLVLEGGVAIINEGTGPGLYADGKTTVEMNESYICYCKGSGAALHFGASLILNDGAVISCNSSNDAGGGIYADSTSTAENTTGQKASSSVILNAGSLVSGNTAEIGGGICIGNNKEFCDKESHETTGMETAGNPSCSVLHMNGGTIVGNTASKYEGGGIALRFNSGARGILYGGKIIQNKTSNTGYTKTVRNSNGQEREIRGAKDWGGGGVFASQGTFLWMPEGADITGNTADGLGGGVTGCSTGKIIIDSSLNIYNNTANGREDATTKGSDKQKDEQYLTDYAYKYKKGQYWKGADIFGAEITQVTGPESAVYKGLAGDQEVEASNGATIRSDDWLVLENTNKQGSSPAHSLMISGNTSTTHGGGVLINGWLITGPNQRIMTGDDIGLTARKKLQDLSGNDVDAVSNDTLFQFILSRDEAGSEIEAEGSVHGSGPILFNRRLTINPTDCLNLGPTDAVPGQFQISYYLKETKNEDVSQIFFDESIYRLDLQVNQKSSQTVQMPLTWNEETQSYESSSVEIVEYGIESMKVYRKDPAHNSFTYLQNVEISTSNSIKQADISSLSSQATFLNILSSKRNITVEKVWQDGDTDAHSLDTVTVYLKRYSAGSDAQNAQIIKAVTLNSDTYQGTKQLPSGVTGEAAGEGIWSWSAWKDMPVKENGQEWIYTVEEECSNRLYEGIITSSTSTHTNQTQPDVTRLDAWVPASSFEKGKSYLIVSAADDQALDMSAYQNEEYKIWPGNKMKLTRIENARSQNGQSVIAYSTSDTPSLFRLSEFNDGGKMNGLIYDHNNVQGWLYGINDKFGLAMGSSDQYKNSSTKGYQYTQGKLQLLTTNNEWRDITYNSSQSDGDQRGTFGSHNHNGGNTVQLYEKGQVLTSTGSPADPGTMEEKFTITNQLSSELAFALQIEKTDQKDASRKLPGATFQLSQTGSQQPMNFRQEDGVYIPDSTGSPDLVTDAQGVLRIYPLASGTYTLEEIVPPEGYRLPEKVEDRTQTIVLSGEQSDSRLDPQTLTFCLSISNEPVTYSLPETGGPGTAIYTVTGASFMLMSACLYRYRKKQQRKEGVS